jgi:hypothetical protein
MKKTNFGFLFLFLVSVFLVSGAGVWAQANSNTAPAFDQQPSVVLDLWNNGGKGKYKDNVKFSNATLLQNIAFNVHGYDEKNRTWTLIGPAQLKYHSDTDTVKSLMQGKLNAFRWIAVHSPTAGINFTAQTAPYSNDVFITILDSVPAVDKPQANSAPVFDMQSSIVLDLWSKVGKGKYKDNLYLKNGTTNQNLSFNIWGYDQKNNQWIIVGAKRYSTEAETPADPTAAAWGAAFGWAVNPDSVNTPWKDKLNGFQWFAIQSLNGVSFDVQAVANRNDLTLMVVDK